MAPKIILKGQRHRVAWKTLLATVLIVLAIPVLFGVFRNARLPDLMRATERASALEAERDQLKAQLRKQQAQLDDQGRQLAYLTHGREIDKQACADARASLTEAQGESAKLREQLAFYRGLVSPETVKAGMRVQNLQIMPGAEPGQFTFQLMLIRPLRRERVATGSVEVSFIGREADGAPRKYLLSQQLRDDPGRLLYSFKQFQEFSGAFTLPVGFKPQRVLVSMAPDGGQTPTINEEFDWSQIQGKSE